MTVYYRTVDQNNLYSHKIDMLTPVADLEPWEAIVLDNI
jgi:Cu2+-containing amine oxidase